MRCAIGDQYLDSLDIDGVSIIVQEIFFRPASLGTTFYWERERGIAIALGFAGVFQAITKLLEDPDE